MGQGLSGGAMCGAGAELWGNVWGTDWLNSMDSINSLVSSGRLVRNRMWLGGFSDSWGGN